jgi:hypothetical protein
VLKINQFKIKSTNSFKNAESFFHACESLKGWDACKDYVADNAEFVAQCEPLTEIKTVKNYVDWMTGFGTITAPGCKYELHASGYDQANNTAIFYATFTGSHSGEGGPVPPTNKTTNTDYVYAFKMNNEEKIVSMTKIWNAPWAMRELGWL